MNNITRDVLLFDVAIDMLVQGKIINEFAFDSILKYYVEISFENKIKSSIKKYGKKNVTVMRVLDKLTESAILTKNGQIMLEVAKTIKGVSIHKLACAIMQTTKMREIESLALLPNAPINELAKHVCKYGSTSNILSFAKNVPNAPIELLEDTIIQKVCNVDMSYGYKKEIVNFAKEVKGANIAKLQKAVLSTNNPGLIYEFGKEVENANIDYLVDTLIKLNATEYYRKFVTNVTNITEDNIKKFAENMKNEDTFITSIIDFASIEKCPKTLARELIEYAITRKVE